MEGVQNNIEDLSGWREEKARASQDVENLLAQIIGFENMSNAEKIAALNALLHELAEDNRNRFVVEAVSQELSRLEENRRHEARLAYLRQAA